MENNKENSDLISRFNLPNYIKGKSFSAASKAIMNKFKGREDNISKSTMMEMLDRLKQAQEYVKKSQEPTNNEFSKGGLMPGEQGGIPGTGYIGMATEALNIGKNLFADPNIDMSGNTQYDKGTGVGDTLGGAMSGAKAGMALGPIGAAVGGVIGGVTSLIGGSKRRDKIMEAQTNKTHNNFNTAMNSYAEGGEINVDPNSLNMYNDGGKVSGKRLYNNIDVNRATKFAKEFGRKNNLNINFDDPNSVKAAQKIMGVKQDGKWGKNTMAAAMKRSPLYISSQKGIETKQNTPDIIPTNNRPFVSSNSSLSSNGIDMGMFKDVNTEPNSDIFENLHTPAGDEKESKNWLQKNGTDLLRAAPIVTNLGQLLSMKKPTKENLAKLDSRYNPQYTDEASMVNQINNSFNEDYVTEGSGGKVGAYRSNARAAQLAKTNAVSDAYRNSREQNNQENRNAQNFNLGIDQYNTGVMHREDENYARDLGAYNTNKSKFISQLGNDVGDLGKELSRDEMIKKMFDYNRKGDYIGTNESSKGGYLDDIFEHIAKNYNKRNRKNNYGK